MWITYTDSYISFQLYKSVSQIKLQEVSTSQITQIFLYTLLFETQFLQTEHVLYMLSLQTEISCIAVTIIFKRASNRSITGSFT